MGSCPPRVLWPRRPARGFCARRQRHRRRHRDQRRDGRGRAEMNGMGGDLFAIVYEAKTRQTLRHERQRLGAQRRSPPEYLQGKGIKAMPQTASIRHHSRRRRWLGEDARASARCRSSTLLAPAIRYADEGFPVGEVDAAYWRRHRKPAHEPRPQHLSDHGHAPASARSSGTRNSHSLELAATGGRDAFYKGASRSKSSRLPTSHGGTMTPADLADYSRRVGGSDLDEYHGWTVYEMPPNGQGSPRSKCST